MIRKSFNINSPIFIPFIMSGYPSLGLSTDAILCLSQVGSDIIELGVPFSDPIADGPINQIAAETAIANGVNLNTVIEQVRTVRALGCTTPIMLFSYFNPILQFGYKKFINDAQDAGINGVLIVDLPPEEGMEFYSMVTDAGLDIAVLISPTTCKTRFPIYAKLDPSFIYYISRLGVTGVQKSLPNNLQNDLRDLRKYFPSTKIVVGFGITTLQQAKEVSNFADGVVVGSKLVDTLQSKGISGFRNLAAEFAAQFKLGYEL